MNNLTNLVIDDSHRQRFAINKAFGKMSKKEIEEKEEEAGKDLDGDGEKGESKEHKRKTKEAKKKKMKKSFDDEIEKAKVKAHTRKTKSGKLSNVKEHEKQFHKKMGERGWKRDSQNSYRKVSRGEFHDVSFSGYDNTVNYQSGKIKWGDFDAKGRFKNKRMKSIDELDRHLPEHLRKSIDIDIEKSDSNSLTNIVIDERQGRASAISDNFQKAHVKAHTRKSKKGNIYQVHEHDDARSKKYLKKMKFYGKMSEKHESLSEKHEKLASKFDVKSDMHHKKDRMHEDMANEAYSRGNREKAKKHDEISKKHREYASRYAKLNDKHLSLSEKHDKKYNRHSERANDYSDKVFNRRYDNAQKKGDYYGGEGR